MVKLGTVEKDSLCWLGRTNQVLYMASHASRLCTVRFVTYDGKRLIPAPEIEVHCASLVRVITEEEAIDILKETECQK